MTPHDQLSNGTGPTTGAPEAVVQCSCYFTGVGGDTHMPLMADALY